MFVCVFESPPLDLQLLALCFVCSCRFQTHIHQMTCWVPSLANDNIKSQPVECFKRANIFENQSFYGAKPVQIKFCQLLGNQIIQSVSKSHSVIQFHCNSKEFPYNLERHINEHGEKYKKKEIEYRRFFGRKLKSIWRNENSDQRLQKKKQNAKKIRLKPRQSSKLFRNSEENVNYVFSHFI